MILFVRTVSIKLGKYRQAVEMAKKCAVLSKTKYNIESELFFQNAGPNPVGTICWEVRFDDYAHYEKFMAEFHHDKDYMKATEKAADYFVSGTTLDSFLEPIPFEEE